MAAGPAKSEDFCPVLGLDDALIVTASGDLRLTPAMEKRLNWRTVLYAFAGDNM